MLGRMSLLRFIARSLVASAFIADGVRKITNPAESAEDAAAFTTAIAPVVQRVVPSGYSSWVPERPETWVRATGGVQLAGGIMFATGLGRRLGALLLAKASVLNVAIAWPGRDAPKAARQAARPEVLQQVALLGAMLLSAQDLEGRPSLAWRTRERAQLAAKAEQGGRGRKRAAAAAA